MWIVQASISDAARGTVGVSISPAGGRRRKATHYRGTVKERLSWGREGRHYASLPICFLSIRLYPKAMFLILKMTLRDSGSKVFPLRGNCQGRVALSVWSDRELFSFGSRSTSRGLARDNQVDENNEIPYQP